MMFGGRSKRQLFLQVILQMKNFFLLHSKTTFFLCRLHQETIKASPFIANLYINLGSKQDTVVESWIHHSDEVQHNEVNEFYFITSIKFELNAHKH